VQVIGYTDREQLSAELAALGQQPVLLVPAGAHRVVGPLDEIAERYGWFDHPVVIADGEALAAMGPAELLHGLVTGTEVEAELDEGRLVLHVLDGGDDLLRVDDRYVHLPTGGEPLVLVGSPDALAGAGEADSAEAECWRTLLTPPDDECVATMAAPELLSVPFWSVSRCDALVTLAASDDAWASDPDDPVPGSEIPLAVLSPALFGALEAEVDVRLIPALRAHWPTFAWCGLDDAFVIRTVATTDVGAGVGEALPLHHDIAQISASLVLSDGHEGGGLEFPRQSWTSEALPVGHLVVWPSLVTHPHRGLPVTAGTRYGLTLWFRLPA
jgi:hypothetical protein